jgi:16S rRNA C1402 N4-methylase RsmH
MNNFLKIGKTVHYPVLHREVSSMVNEFISSVEDSKGQHLLMFDGTFGGGNHSVQLLEEHRPLKVLGTDLDKTVVDQCKLEYEKYVK